jgi:hypothetical protein
VTQVAVYTFSHGTLALSNLEFSYVLVSGEPVNIDYSVIAMTYRRQHK